MENVLDGILVLAFFCFGVMAHLLKDVIFIRNGKVDLSEALFFIMLLSFIFLIIVGVLL